MTGEEALKTALDMETKISELYRELGQNLNNEVARKVFSTLAMEEEGHVAYLQNKLEECQTSGNISAGKLTSVVPDKAFIEEKVKSIDKPEKTEAFSNEVDALRQALEMEKQISALYRDLVQHVPAEFKSLFEGFIEIEDNHEAVVQAELFSAKASGVFFDFLEFDQEAG